MKSMVSKPEQSQKGEIEIEIEIGLNRLPWGRGEQRTEGDRGQRGTEDKTENPIKKGEAGAGVRRGADRRYQKPWGHS